MSHGTPTGTIDTHPIVSLLGFAKRSRVCQEIEGLVRTDRRFVAAVRPHGPASAGPSAGTAPAPCAGRGHPPKACSTRPVPPPVDKCRSMWLDLGSPTATTCRKHVGCSRTAQMLTQRNRLAAEHSARTSTREASSCGTCISVDAKLRTARPESSRSRQLSCFKTNVLDTF